MAAVGAVAMAAVALALVVVWRTDGSRPTATMDARVVEVAATVPFGTAVQAIAAPVVPVEAPPATTATVLDGPASECPSTAHGVVVDRATQRAWLCGDGALVAAMPITSAWSMPDPGTYPVYAKDLTATSTFGGHASSMTHFVAFSHGERTGARVAFHSMPTLRDGSFVQPLETIGQLGMRGESSGCIRLVPDDALRIWEWLAVGDEVHVVT